MIVPRFRLRVPNIPLLNPQASARVVDEELRRAMEETVLVGEREVKEWTPVGATGILRGSITSAVRGTPARLRGVITSPQPYAQPVEEGTRPHWAPIGPLLLWAQRVLGDARAAYRVRWAIYRRGTRGVHMFREAGRVLQQRAPQIFNAAVERIRRRLGG
jgi:hypothetical protein